MESMRIAPDGSTLARNLSFVMEKLGSTEEQIKEAMENTGLPFEIVTPVHKAIESVKEVAQKEDVILIAGSVFLVGEAREYWYPHSSNSG